MRARGTLILLVLFAIVGGYALFVERERPTAKEREERERVILDLDPAGITEIRLTGRESTLALARRKRSPWELVEPRRVPANQDAASSLAGFFDDLRAERWLVMSSDAGAVDTVATGIADPWLRVTVAAADSTTTDSTSTTRHELVVGTLNPSGSAYYARIDLQPRIALIPARLVDNNLKPSFSSLRDRHLARFDTEAACRIELTTPDLRVVLAEEEDGAWRIAKPPLPADETEVRSLLERIARLEAVDFVEEGSIVPVKLAAYGLAPPRITAVIRGPMDTLLARLDIGAAAPGGAYARGSGLEAVLVVPPGVAEELTPTLEALRDRRLLDLGGSEIDTLHVISDLGSVVAARDSTGSFRRTRTKEHEDPEADRVVLNLPYIRVTAFVDESARTPSELRGYGLEAPTLRLELRLRNGETRDVAFGRTEEAGVFACRSGRPGVVLVSKSTVSDLRGLLNEAAR